MKSELRKYQKELDDILSKQEEVKDRRTSMNIAYISLGVSIIAVILAAIALFFK